MTSNDICVSVIIAVYDLEEYIDRCINSVLAQSHPNLEIILVDDGSTDNSGEICRKYASTDSRIIYLRKDNGGVSSARNHGIKAATSNYLCFIDGDDWIEPDYVRQLLSLLVKYEADIAQCGFYRTNKRKAPKKELIYVSSGNDALKKLHDRRVSIYMILPWNKLYKKELFADIRYETGIIHEILYAAKRFVFSNRPLYNYCVREASLTRTVYDKKIFDIVYVFEKRLSFYEDKNEHELFDMTMVNYFRVLHNIYRKMIKQKMLDGIEEIKDKIDTNMNAFAGN